MNTKAFTYNDVNKKIASQTVSSSIEGESFTTNYFYHSGNSPLSKNRIGLPERTEKYKGSLLLSTENVAYGNSWGSNASYLSSAVQFSKGSNPLVSKASFSRYDEFGNMLEMQENGGMVTSYIWGYNKTLLVAKIENLSYSSIPTNLVAAIENASNTYSEANTLTALANLRSDPALANAMVTTYTYLPLVGISTITDVRGERLTHIYDTFNELKIIKDKDGNIISEKITHYSTQN